ncbi:MAG TPA: hypothetical protein VFY40_22795 [Blastocatellia bacterium]|nr:hypothetical protein [Blastocatellia bacterium]
MADRAVAKTGLVNNDIYDQLGERWYTARDDPIALLRAESRASNPWIAGSIRQAFPSGELNTLTNQVARWPRLLVFYNRVDCSSSPLSTAISLAGCS